MTISNWTKKLRAAAIAGGLLAPLSVDAAALHTNLIDNPSFEHVDTSFAVGSFGGVSVNVGWDDIEGGGIYAIGAYNFSTGYANGATPSGAGDYFLTTNAGANAGQSIDLSSGATAVAIAGGDAKFTFSGFFSNYAGDGDYAVMTVTFADANGDPTGTPTVIDSSTEVVDGAIDWVELSAAGSIPLDAESAAIEIVGFNAGGALNNSDGYVDLVSFQVVPEPASALAAGLGVAVAAGAGRRRDD